MKEIEKFRKIIYQNFNKKREAGIIRKGRMQSGRTKTQEYKYQFTIIIPVYNKEDTVKNSIDSALGQKGVDLQVIVINDGSTDQSADLCRKYVGKEHYVFLEQENSGPSVARNRGLELAAGRYIAFLDADDMLEENALAAAYKIMTYNHLEVLCFDTEEFNPDGRKICSHSPVRMKSGEILSGEDYILKYGYHISCTVWNYFFSKSFLDSLEIRFVPGLLHEDCEFTAHYFPYVTRFSYISESFYRQVLSPDSIMRSNNIQKSYDLVEVSRMIYQDAEVMKMFLSKKTVRHIYQYAASEAWLSIKSCVQMGYDLNGFLADDGFRNRLLVLLRLGNKYKIIYYLVRYRQYRMVRYLIRTDAIKKAFRGK